MPGPMLKSPGWGIWGHGMETYLFSTLNPINQGLRGDSRQCSSKWGNLTQQEGPGLRQNSETSEVPEILERIPLQLTLWPRVLFSEYLNSVSFWEEIKMKGLYSPYFTFSSMSLHLRLSQYNPIFNCNWLNDGNCWMVSLMVGWLGFMASQPL